MVVKSHIQGSDLSCKICALTLSAHFDIDQRIMIFAFKLLANYDGNYMNVMIKCTVVTICDWAYKNRAYLHTNFGLIFEL